MRFVNTIVMNHPDSISFSLRIAFGFERSLGFFDMTEEFWGLRSDYLPRVLYLFRRVIESDNNRVRHGETTRRPKLNGRAEDGIILSTTIVI